VVKQLVLRVINFLFIRLGLNSGFCDFSWLDGLKFEFVLYRDFSWLMFNFDFKFNFVVRHYFIILIDQGDNLLFFLISVHVLFRRFLLFDNSLNWLNLIGHLEELFKYLPKFAVENFTWQKWVFVTSGVADSRLRHHCNKINKLLNLLMCETLQNHY